MPTYQYACTECGHQLEAVQSFSDAPLTDCPACEGRLRKLFNSVGIVFKGSGFYRTDSRGKNGSDASGGSEATKKPADSSVGSSANGSSSGGTSSDSAGSSTSSASSGSGSSGSGSSGSGTSGSGTSGSGTSGSAAKAGAGSAA